MPLAGWMIGTCCYFVEVVGRTAGLEERLGRIPAEQQQAAVAADRKWAEFGAGMRGSVRPFGFESVGYCTGWD